MATPMHYSIRPLDECPHFAGIIADRCWHAWWQDSDVSPAQYREWVDECTQGKCIPSCFVAHKGGIYLGSASLIADDLEAGPQYTPWIAALWVEESHRHQGIATALMDEAAASASALGFSKTYLCAALDKTAFYSKRGFTVIEEDVEGLTVFTRTIAST
jgi:predicted N-acetyltransferase YhbS